MEEPSAVGKVATFRVHAAVLLGGRVVSQLVHENTQRLLVFAQLEPGRGRSEVTETESRRQRSEHFINVVLTSMFALLRTRSNLMPTVDWCKNRQLLSLPLLSMTFLITISTDVLKNNRKAKKQ